EAEARAVAEQARVEAELLSAEARARAEEALLALEEQMARIESERARAEAEAKPEPPDNSELMQRIAEAEDKARMAEAKARGGEEERSLAEAKLLEEIEARARAEQAEAEARARAEQAEAEAKAKVQAAERIREEAEQGRSEAESEILEVEDRFQHADVAPPLAANVGVSAHQRVWQMDKGAAPAIALPSRVGAMALALNLFLKTKPKLVSYWVIIFLILVALVWVGSTIILLLKGDV